MGSLSNKYINPQSALRDRLARLRVVVSDGQDFFLHQTRRSLTQLGVSDIHLARDGAEALGLVRTREPHLAIIDWGMPAIPGLEFTYFLRRAEGSPAPGLPIVMTMNALDKGRVSKALAAGVNEILIKPVTADNLMKRVVAALTGVRARIASASYTGPDRRRADHPYLGDERRVHL